MNDGEPRGLTTRQRLHQVPAIQIRIIKSPDRVRRVSPTAETPRPHWPLYQWQAKVDLRQEHGLVTGLKEGRTAPRRQWRKDQES